MTGFVLLGGLLAVGFTCLRLQARAMRRAPVRARQVLDAPRMWEDDIDATRERETGDFDLWEADMQTGSGL